MKYETKKQCLTKKNLKMVIDSFGEILNTSTIEKRALKLC